MVAQYPDQVKQFTAKLDLVDTVMADHVNVLQDEVKAIESTLGAGILYSDYTGTFDDVSGLVTPWSNLTFRLTNIEHGLVNGVPNAPYVLNAGGSTVAPNGVIGLTMQTAAGTSNLFETRASNSTLGFNVNYQGVPKMGTSNVLYVNGSDYNYLLTLIAAAQATADSSKNTGTFHPFLLAGM